jgi:Neprosin
VQTNGDWTIGGALSPASTQGGQQLEIEVGVFLEGGNWWIYLGGLEAANAVGFYPTLLYNGGQMASNATEILFGSETVCNSASWPPMGSGAMAATGWQQAAYQRDIFYFPIEGGCQWAALTPEQPSPGCYTLALASDVAPWGTYFYYGGPGGTDC